MTVSRCTWFAVLALFTGGCGVADSDPSLWKPTKDLGGTQFVVGGPGAAGSQGAAGDTGQPPNGSAGDVQGTGNVPVTGAGGETGIGQGSGGMMMQFPPPGSGGFVTGAGGFLQGAGGFVSGSGGSQQTGSGGSQQTGAGGTQATGNSGKCTFTFNVTTVTANGRYAPANVGAIWITDSSNKFVKTLQVWGSIRLSNATAWTQSSGNNTTDAVTGATRRGHGALTAKWDCTNVSKTAVMDGSYNANVTFAESDSNPFFGGTAIQTAVKFAKSSAGATVMGTDTSNFKSMTVTLAPAP